VTSVILQKIFKLIFFGKYLQTKRNETRNSMTLQKIFLSEKSNQVESNFSAKKSLKINFNFDFKKSHFHSILFLSNKIFP